MEAARIRVADEKGMFAMNVLSSIALGQVLGSYSGRISGQSGVHIAVLMLRVWVYLMR